MKTVKIKSFITKGIEAIPVEVSVSIADGIGIHLVGVQDIFVKEILLRSVTALQALGYSVPGRKIIINVKAADGLPVTVCASNLDLAVAVGILAASGQWKESIEHLSDFAVVGELGLDGNVRPVMGELAMTLASDRIILPYQNAVGLAHKPGVEDRGRVYAVKTLNDIKEILGFPERYDALDAAPEKTGKQTQEDDADTAFIDSSSDARSALLVAAAGGHSINLVAFGGRYLTKCLHSILPRLTEKQYIDTEKVYETSGMHLPDMITPPMCVATSNSSLSVMVGGGANVKPGEVSLANGGLLVLRDLADWPKATLETIHRVKEDGFVKLARLRSTVQFPAEFLLAGAVHPGEKFKEKAEDIFDISYPVNNFSISKTPVGESSKDLRKRVEKARAIQAKRYRNENFKTNSGLKGGLLDKYINLSDDAKELMKNLPAPPEFNNVGNVSRLKRVARTFADLDGDKEVEKVHILKALNLITMC